MNLEDKVRRGDVWRKHKDPLGFFRTHYEGLTRGELLKEDPGLYNRLRNDGLIEEISTIRKRVDFGDDLFQYYQQHYNGMTRGELSKENPALYQRLLKKGLIKEVPTIVSDFGNDPVQYYKSNHYGKTRRELAREKPGLYSRLLSDRLIEHVPTREQKKLREARRKKNESRLY